MDHAYIEAHDLYEGYIAGRLSEEDREAFEAHYFDCDACLRQLELAEDFREGMSDVRLEGAAQNARQAAPLGLLAALALTSRGRRIALAGALLLLAALPAALLWKGRFESPEKLRPQGPTAQEARISELEGRLRGIEANAGRERQLLLEELIRERKARAAAEAKGTPTAQVNLPLYVLAAVRGGDEGREPVNRLTIPPDAAAIVVTLELAAVDYPTYRARLRDGAGREVWQAEGLRPNERDTLVLLLPSPLVPPGTYELRLEGGSLRGEPVTLQSYPFRTVRPR
jgi:hypothetical protein